MLILLEDLAPVVVAGGADVTDVDDDDIVEANEENDDAEELGTAGKRELEVCWEAGQSWIVSKHRRS